MAGVREAAADRASGGVLVLGMGATGASCARFLAARGRQAWFADSRGQPPGLAAIRDALPGASLSPGAIPATVPAGVEQVLVSPGVDLGLPVLEDARRRGIGILSDIDLFVREARAPVIGITGSNGKSTVTSMLGAMLRGAGWTVGVGGNLGTPALDLLDPANRAYVLELSSFQLERSGILPLAAAVVLNVSPDHLDIHGDMTGYTAAKARIYDGARVAVVNRDAPELAGLVPAGSRTVSFGLGHPEDGHFGLRVNPDGVWLAQGWDFLVPVSALKVTGRHNLANALAALALGTALGLRAEQLVPGLKACEPLPHRMTVVSRDLGITWIDDSKATNEGAAVTSIGSVEGPFVLIAGGDGKGADFRLLADALRGRQCVAVLLGRDRDQLAAALAGICEVRLVDTMGTAVAEARSIAREGWTVLLAPARSSLDMFRDYGARGDAFRDAVLGRSGAGRASP